MTMPVPPIRAPHKIPGFRLLGVVLTAAVVTTVMPVKAADAPVVIPDFSATATSEKPAYYVIKRIAITSDVGVRNINVGTKVELMSKAKGSCRIRLSDRIQVDTTMDHLTLDADAANRLADQERAARETHDAALRQQIDADQARLRAQAAANEAAMREAQQKVPPTITTASSDAPPPQMQLPGSALDDRSGTVAKVAHPKAPAKKK
jgi:uncharacterized protein YhaN